MTTIIILVVAVGFFIAGLAVMWWLKKEKIIRASTLHSAVEKANEMVTLHSYFQHIIQAKEIALKFSESKLLARCNGEIVCSFDMSKASLDVNEEKKHATIKMPSCELRTIIDVNDVEVYDVTRGIIDFLWDVVKFEHKYDYNKVREIVAQERPKITQEAREKFNLAGKAKDNARHVLENLASKNSPQRSNLQGSFFVHYCFAFFSEAISPPSDIMFLMNSGNGSA